MFTSGMPNASGLIERKDYRSEEDCPVVTYMKKAGAIPFCITNVSELCMWYESANRLYGRTRNPYNTVRIVGGSSGIHGEILVPLCNMPMEFYNCIKSVNFEMKIWDVFLILLKT